MKKIERFGTDEVCLSEDKTKVFLERFTDEQVKDFLENYESPINKTVLKMDVYDQCIIGLVHNLEKYPILCYDKDQVLDALAVVFKYDTTDDPESDPYTVAVEWYEFNMLGAWLGDGTPCFLYESETDEMEDSVKYTVVHINTAEWFIMSETGEVVAHHDATDTWQLTLFQNKISEDPNKSWNYLDEGHTYLVDLAPIDRSIHLLTHEQNERHIQMGVDQFLNSTAIRVPNETVWDPEGKGFNFLNRWPTAEETIDILKQLRSTAEEIKFIKT